jgi:hypothetical protein
LHRRSTVGYYTNDSAVLIRREVYTIRDILVVFNKPFFYN